MTIKTCSKCTEEKDISLFIKNRNVCKECAKAYKKKSANKKDDMDPNAILECIKCGEKKKYELFIKRSNKCKDCNNKERRERAAKKKVQLDPDKPKTCLNCKETKTESDFELGSNNCKTCRNNKKKNRLKKYAENMPEQKLCKDCGEFQSSDNFRLGENVCYECSKIKLYKWRKDNQEKFEGICAKYRSKPDYREKQNKGKRERYNSSPNEKLSLNYRSYMRDYIFRDRITKGIDKLIGLDREKMKDWLEFNFKPGMTWDNYGTFWNIDHVKPCSKFDLTDSDELKDCFSWKNTLPVYCKENLQKYDKENEHNEGYMKIRSELFMHRKTQYNIRKAKKLKEKAKVDEYFDNIKDSDDDEKIKIVKTIKVKMRKSKPLKT
jgi:hypothetical protein